MKIIDVDYDWAGPLVRRTRTELIVLHHSAGGGSALDVHRLHLQNGWVGIGYNYYIRKDGLIYRGRPEDCVGAHTVGYNDRSIGICFEGNFEEEQMSAVQMNSGIWLIKDIWQRYGSLGIIGHRDADATACPGRLFPMEEMKSLAEKGDDKPSEWAKEACEWAIAEGLFHGDGKGNYRWQENVTREELAIVLQRLTLL